MCRGLYDSERLLRLLHHPQAECWYVISNEFKFKFETQASAQSLQNAKSRKVGLSLEIPFAHQEGEEPPEGEQKNTEDP